MGAHSDAKNFLGKAHIERSNARYDFPDKYLKCQPKKEKIRMRRGVEKKYVAKCLIEWHWHGRFMCIHLLMLQLRLNYHDLVMHATEFAFHHSEDRLQRCRGCWCYTTAKMLLIIRLYHFIMNYFSCINLISLDERHTMESPCTKLCQTIRMWRDSWALPEHEQLVYFAIVLSFRKKNIIRLRTIFAYFIKNSIVRSHCTQRSYTPYSY